MNSLFKATRKEPASASVFKFSFKLGGDEDLEEDAPTKKKNKNKKKKKKPAAGVAEKDDSNVTENLEPVDDEVDEMESLLKEVQISVENQQISLAEDGATNNNTTENEEKTLSKSQKKNLQKKKAKKSGELGVPADAASVHEVVDAKEETGKSKTTKATKTKESKPIVESDDEFAMPEPKVSKKNKSKKPEPKAKAKPASVTPKPTGLAFAHLVASEPASQQRGPHFISSKDPELDEATKLRFKYGMGRNLVAIGPAKVRDPNWLPPPPGLTRLAAPMKGIFNKSASPEKKAPVKTSVATEATEEVHSSPFSFSFNGL